VPNNPWVRASFTDSPKWDLCFSGIDKAITLCQDIAKYNFVVQVEPQDSRTLKNDKTLYRLVEHNPNKSLNTHAASYDILLAGIFLMFN